MQIPVQITYKRAVVCLSETAVLDLLGGKLAEGSTPGAEEHLAACADCRRLVSELSRTLDGPADSGPTPIDPTRLSPGIVVAGRFRLERLLGTGGMGEVWAAEHLVTRRKVALKLVRAAAEERGRLRVQREARAAGAVHHPGILPVIDVLELDDGTPALLMDLLSGRSLGARLAATGPLTSIEAARVLLPVAEAVRAAHAKGVIHRDLKPDNVFLCDDGSVKVLDFGVAKVVTPGEGERLDLTRTGELIGTPHYMAPEQAFGERDLDGRIDIWALGVTLYECLAGARPFAGESLGQLLRAVSAGRIEPIGARVPGLPPQLARLCDRMLAVDRERRPTLDEIVDGLRAAADGAPTRTGSRRWLIASLVTLLAGAGAGVAWRLAHHDPSHARPPAGATNGTNPNAIHLDADHSRATVSSPAPTDDAKASPQTPPLPTAPSIVAPINPAVRRILPVRAHTDTATGNSPAHVQEPSRGPGGVIEQVPF